MTLAATLRASLAAGMPAVLVRLAEAKGSTPREAGTVMAVTADAIYGTIGGGQFEWLAIDHARRLIADRPGDTRLDIPLGADIGQCCGGRVALAFEPVTADTIAALEAEEATEKAARPDVHIFGAGHVGRALAAAFLPLPVNVAVHDTRQTELDRLPEGAEAVLSAMPEAAVATARPGSAFVITTHDHALDFMIAAEALKRDDAAYVGLIGSKTKRAKFKAWLAALGGNTGALSRLVCPIGAGAVADKRPEVIAAMTVAEILTALTDHRTAQGERHARPATATP